MQYIQLNKSVADSISIKIDGQINNNFWGKREFNGRIYCDAINLNGEYFNLIFDDSNKAYLSITKKVVRRLIMVRFLQIKIWMNS